MPRLPYAELEAVPPDLIELRPPEYPLLEASDPPALAYFVQHAQRSELRVAYKALVGLLVGDQGLEGPEAETAHRMYLALQRELDRRLQASIQPYGEETPLPF
ncbi:hypothetical protein [Meiothermus granaticius]|uniref:Uncharacterized protein n=1 Tax=Meiothermus granaticius NBRC 107808 TaxID=1227551 RepID=A0A399F7T2_9DEIN|nr:hypothetical protein [Meiothermus granaticius]RIH91795.1 hypothetical protein Mgrana_02295 [Meiothermus granaticius NBRC 107808]GEM87899.1 hypothetical protein MGR01S_25240 [Meiothermus granaticius NBRC 107808]